MKKLFIILFCLKVILLDQFFYCAAFSQSTVNNFNLVKAKSKPVSFNTLLLPATVSLNSDPVSFSLSQAANQIKLASVPVSYSISQSAGAVKLSSLPVSYSLRYLPAAIRLSSLPVSYLLDSFSGNLISVSSDKVAYKVFNGVPVLEGVSPNLLPILQNGKSISISLLGDNFITDSVVTIGTLKIDTKFISSMELVATVPANFLGKENSFEVFAVNPPPDGGISKGLNVKVIDPVPVAKISATPNIGVAPQIVTFDGTKTEDLLAKYFGEDLSYSWNFGDDGTLDTLAGSVVTHAYKTPGKYIVTLNVLNAYGKTSRAVQEIEIREKNFAPEGTFKTSVTDGDVPLEVIFTSAVTDKENDEISYLWDFNDGQISTDKNPKHTYIIPGKYQPKLTVSDPLGAKTTITSPGKLVLLPPNNPPLIEIAAVPQISILKPNSEGLYTSIVQFISNGTYDPDGEDLTYKWDFGDGYISDEVNPKHEYKEKGEYSVKLTVSDSRGEKTTKETKVTVSKPNPVAQAIVNETSGNAPFEVTFDGKASRDFDGRPVTLQWGFGDKTTQTINSTEGIVKHTYEDPGVYLVTLTAVTPDNRSLKINPANIIVGQNNAPVGKITVLEGDSKGIAGKARVKLSAGGSYDPFGSPLKYKWSWSARTWDTNGNLADISKEVNEQLQNTNDVLEYTFARAGQYTPVLEIEKADGTKAKFYGETFTILSEQSPVAVAKIISEETEGNPGLEISFDASESYDPKPNGGIKILSWDFGDGEKSIEISPKHIYNKEGTYTPTLIVIDSENNIGFAQAASVKITNKPEEIVNKNLTRTSLLMFQQSKEQLSEENIKELTDAMIKEALDSYISTDNEKPQIGPITLEPKIVNAGEVINLSAYIKDNIALSNFGYSLVNQDKKVILQKSIDLINNEEKILQNETYIEEQIPIPPDLPIGIYSLKLTATDTGSNQIAEERAGNNEEIILNFEIRKSGSAWNLHNKFIEPSEIKEAENNEAIKTEIKTRKLLTDKIIKTNTNFHLKNKNILITEAANLKTTKPKILKNKAKLKFQTVGFSVTEVSPVINPWISLGPASKNSLLLDTIKEGDGFIEIGTKGSLSKNNFSNWASTNIYVDFKKAGNIFWALGSRISFTSNQSSIVKYVQFRPVNKYGIELPSETWAGNYFIFRKILKPEVTSVTPKEYVAGRGSIDLNIFGNNFGQTSKIIFDGVEITPYAISNNLLIAMIDANLIKNYGEKSVYVRNADGALSNSLYFNVKQNLSSPCSVKKSLPQEHWGADAWTILSGTSTYLTSPGATIEGNGSVIIPFCLDKDYEVKTSLDITHYKSGSSVSNFITFWLDGNYTGGKISYKSENLIFDNLITKNLGPGLHTLEIKFSAPTQDALVISKTTFSNGSGPALDLIEPDFVSKEGIGRTLKLKGRNFDNNTNVFLDNEIKTKTFVSENEIIVSLPDKFSSGGPKEIYLTGNSKKSSILLLSVKEGFEIINNSFVINPKEPFPGNSFTVTLKIFDKLVNVPANYKAEIAVYDPDDKLLIIPNISNNISTITLNGNVESENTSGKTISFSGSVPLDLKVKPGNYKIIVSVKRNSQIGEDYSSIESYKYITARALGLSYADNLIPASHRLNFTPKPAVGTVFGIEENNAENIGFVQTGNKVIQDNQAVKFKVQVSTGTEHASKLRYNFISGDGRESGLTTNDNYTFTYRNPDKSTGTPLTANPKLEIFWTEDGTQTKIVTHSGLVIFIYPNYNPVAKAKVNGNIFATSPPLAATFLDLDSYDPNQKFSGAIDFADPKQNDWKLYQLIFNQDAMLISLPVDAKISDDRKTFFSGNLYTPGSYFSRLTVQDKTGLTDTASTESVTLTKPSQMIIVFATVDPRDKRVFDPVIARSECDEAISEGCTGIPVMFRSGVTRLGGSPVLSYRWDFADGSCIGDDITKLPEDCTSPNPKHYYFDERKSFMGQRFTDRKSVTPKLTVTAVFKNGTRETWEALTGTITFNADPHFVLLDVLPDITSGVVPFTVNLMIDTTTAKTVGATVTSYDIDFGDGTIESNNITYQELISKTFTHTYTVPDTYNPRLTVSIKESDKKFVFEVAGITASGTGTSGVYLLDDLSTTTFTNQPIVTFMVLAVYANPLDINNSLKIKVKDKEGNTTVTELDPANSSQTISLSEGENTYYFESSDSSSRVIRTEEKTIILDAIKPLLEIISPDENEILNENQKLIISGIIDDENLDLISYKVNQEGKTIIIPQDEPEDLGDNKKAFNITLDPNSLGYQISKVEIVVKDKAGNVTSEEINIDSERKTRFLTQTLLEPRKIYNNASNPPLKAGEAFQLVSVVDICDDKNKKKDGIEAKLILESASYTINNTLNYATLNKNINGLGEIIPGIRGVKLDGCIGTEVYYSPVFNLDNSVSEQFLVQSPLGNPSLYWPYGHYEIINTLTAHPQSKTDYGTTFREQSLTSKVLFALDVIRETEAKILAFMPKSLNLNQENQIKFKLNILDSILFNSERLPVIRINDSYIQAPNGTKDKINLSCQDIPNQSLPDREISKNCSFSYTPKEYTKGDKTYSLIVPVEFPNDNENKIILPASYNDIKVNFEAPAKIILPADYTVNESKKEIIRAEFDKNLLPEELKTEPDKKIKKLAKYGIRFNEGSIKTIASLSNDISIVKGVNLTPDIITFDCNLNFNLSAHPAFTDSFSDLSVFGPVYLYTAVSSSDLQDTLFNYSEPVKLTLLDKSIIRKMAVKSNLKTNTKVLNLTVTTNAGFGSKYPLYLKVEPYDENNNLIGTEKQFDLNEIKIPKSKGSKTITVKDLPSETKEIKATLYRNENFLKLVQKRLDKENFAFNILTDPKYKIASEKTVKLSDKQTNTSCSLNPDTASTTQSVDFKYELNSIKSVKVTADGKKPDGTIIKSISLPSQFQNKTDWAKSGIITFAVPDEWGIYSEAIFTLTSGDERDECTLKIKEKEFFTELSQETDTIKLPFVQNETATIPDDQALNIKSVSFPFSEELTLEDFKQLLKDLKLLPEENNNGYDLETQEAAYELLYLINNLRCEQKDIIDSDIRAQVSLPIFQCNISTSNYQEYILNSIKQNLPYIVLIKELTSILKPIGLQSLPADSDLSDSVLFRAIANEGVLVPLPPWAKVALWLGAYIITTALANQKLKSDYFTQTKDSTCTKTFGTIDRRFAIGKDLNNLDRKRTNTMVGVLVDNSPEFKVNIIEPFVHIPQYPGVYSTCLPEGSHTITLQFNDQNTFSMSVTVPRTQLLNFVEPFIGGVFRKYGTKDALTKIIASKRILDSGVGDIQSSLDPTGAGAYLTSLSIKPNVDASTSEIAEALRLYKAGTFEIGNPNSKGVIESERANSYIDLALDTRAIYLQTNNNFPLQFVLPSTFLDFVEPNEKSFAIIIDRFGL